MVEDILLADELIGQRHQEQRIGRIVGVDDVETACGSPEVADSGEEDGQYDNADANRRDKAECLVE